MEPEVEQSVDKHIVKHKGRSIMRQHIKNKLIKWGFRMWYRCVPRTGYLYEFDVYTGKSETTESGLGESVVLQLKEKLNGSFCHIFLDSFFTSPSLYGKEVVQQNRKLLPKIEKLTKKKSQAGKKQKK